MGKSSPRPPDPAAVAQQQQQANQQSAEQTLRLNALDRTGPFGSATFTRDASGLPTGQNVSIDPGLQAIGQQAIGTGQGLGAFLPQDAFRLADVPQGMDLQNNFFQQQLGLLQPQFEDQLRNFNVRASERGLPIGSEAESNFLEPILRSQNQALQQAAFGAVQLTPGEEQRQIQNALLERQLPFQEVGQSLGLLNQIPQPGFAPQPSAGIQAPDIQGLQQQDFLNRQGIVRDKNAALGAVLGGLSSVATAPLSGPAGAQTVLGRILG